MASPPSKRVIATDEIVNPPSWLEKVVTPVNAFIKGVSSALDRGLTLRENFAGEVRVIEITPPEDWQHLTNDDLINGWTLYPPPFRLSLRKLLDGEVQLRGLAVPGAIGGGGAGRLFEWPTGYAPEQAEIWNPQASTGWAEAYATEQGVEVTRLEVGGATWVSFSGFRFTALDRTPPRWATPVDVKLGTEQAQFPGRPATVTVLKCKQKRDASLPAPVAHIDWEPVNLERQKSAPGIRIHRVWGLEPGVTYTLTLHITPE